MNKVEKFLKSLKPGEQYKVSFSDFQDWDPRVYVTHWMPIPLPPEDINLLKEGTYIPLPHSPVNPKILSVPIPEFCYKSMEIPDSTEGAK